MAPGCCIQLTVSVFCGWVTMLWEPSSPPSDTHRHLPQWDAWHSPWLPLLVLLLPRPLWCCGSSRTLLPLLALLLERAPQKRAVHGVVHVFVFKPGAQHSLSLFLPLDYVCSIKCVFKSHVRGCGLKLAGVNVAEGHTFDHGKSEQRLIQGCQGEVTVQG